jgi:hypothetical protein
MRRRLLNLLTAVSLLLCVAAGGLWARSRVLGHSDWFSGSSASAGRQAMVIGGTVYLRHITSPRAWWRPAPWTYERRTNYRAFTRATDLQLDVASFGFSRHRGTLDGSPFTETWLIFPLWAVVLATAGLPVLWLTRRVRRRMNSEPGHCPVCGYDLRGTPERCPECGTLRGAAERSAR